MKISEAQKVKIAALNNMANWLGGFVHRKFKVLEREIANDQ